MDNTNIDGENVASDEKASAVPPETQEQGQAGKQAVSIGFTDDGYFLVRLPVTLGFHALLGWLDEAKDQLKGLESAARRKMAEDKDKTKLVRPGFRGRFNLFK